MTIEDQADARDQDTRRRAMAILSRADGDRIESLWQNLDLDPECEILREPEAGLIMLRGRIGGGGDAFNLGEATATRATVRANGNVGHAIVLGRDARKAKLAAVIDALCLDDDIAARIDGAILSPLETEQRAADRRRRDETAATKVDFFTMVRGDD